MKSLADLTDETKLKLYEIESIVKCVCNALQCYNDTEDKDCSHILPLAEIARERLARLSTDYEVLEGEIYRRFIL